MLKKAADMVNASLKDVEEAFDAQFKFISNHIKSRSIDTVMLKRLGKFKLSGRYKGPESFDRIDSTKNKQDVI